MRHRKTPGWVMELKRHWAAPPAYAIMLSDLIGTIEVECIACSRHGRYRADRLLTDFGDIGLPELRLEIAKRGKCHRALNPPPVASADYGRGGCRIRIVGAYDAKGPG